MIPLLTSQPYSFEEFIGQTKPILTIHSFFEQFKKGRALLIQGPCGTGKTSSIHLYAKLNDYDLLELNASDARNQKTLEEFLSKVTGQMSLFATKKIILLDEIDGLSGTKDRGALTSLLKFIKSSPFPIVMTGIDLSDKKFSAIKKESLLVSFLAVSPKELIPFLEKKSQDLGFTFPQKTLSSIAYRCGGDVRAALTDLFCVMLTNQTNDNLENRRQTQDLLSVLTKVFKATKPEISLGAYDLVDEDLDKIFLWVDENIPREYTSPKDISKAYQTLALADVFFGRIRKWQYYRYYVYCFTLLSAGISLSKQEKYSGACSFRQPSRLLKYWQANMTYAKRKSIVEKLALAQKISKKNALQSSFYYLLPALVNDPDIAQELCLTKDELVWLEKQHSSS
jgi:replication factor C large subunit